MSELEECFRVGKKRIAAAYGTFDKEPDGWDSESGLLDHDMAGYTQSNIPREQNGAISMVSSDAEPERIAIDESLNKPQSCRVLLHELLEWRAAEVMHSDEVLKGDTDHAASFAENHICDEVNSELGDGTCDMDFARDLDTVP